MKTQTEALKMALEALDQLTNAADTFSVSGVYFNEEVWAKKCLSDAYFAITTIEEALAQQEGQSNYCLQCEALSRELAALKAQQSNAQSKCNHTKTITRADIDGNQIETTCGECGERVAQQSNEQVELVISKDAYDGAREDLSIWKKRALEAEELNRKFIAEINGPTFMGEPVTPFGLPLFWDAPAPDGSLINEGAKKQEQKPWHYDEDEAYEPRIAKKTVTQYTHPPVPTAQPKEPEQQPVAEIVECSVNGQQTVVEIEGRWKFLKYGTKLYTTPPQRKPLTRGQIREIEVDVSLNPSFDYITPAEQLCRAIEAAHGIKE